jgi:hypothetical protein
MKVLTLTIALFTSFAVFGQENSWTIEKRELPLDESFDAGSRVEVIIDYENYTTVDYVNESEATVVIIHNVSEDGIPVSEEKIGPVRFRTKTLKPGEEIQMTHNWEKGHKISFEITGGKTHIKVKPKKRSI